MSWASRKKTAYRRIAILIAIVIIALVSFLTFYNPPTCQDNKQNQGEEGIDCGGPCDLVCGFTIIDPIVRWSRVLKTYAGVYSVVAMIENLNVLAEARSVPYIFKLYDDQGLLINERKGEVFIPSNKIFPIFEGAITAGNRIPQRVNFEFLQKPKWVKTQTPASTDGISVRNIKFFEKNNLPRVSAVIENNLVTDIKNAELIILIYDKSDNLINSSKTVLDLVKTNSSEKIIFTWPTLFEAEVSKIDIIPVSKLN